MGKLLSLKNVIVVTLAAVLLSAVLGVAWAVLTGNEQTIDSNTYTTAVEATPTPTPSPTPTPTPEPTPTPTPTPVPPEVFDLSVSPASGAWAVSGAVRGQVTNGSIKLDGSEITANTFSDLTALNTDDTLAGGLQVAVITKRTTVDAGNPCGLAWPLLNPNGTVTDSYNNPPAGFDAQLYAGPLADFAVANIIVQPVSDGYGARWLCFSLAYPSGAAGLGGLSNDTTLTFQQSDTP